MQHKAVYILFCKLTLHVSGSTTTIISSTQNCKYSVPPTWQQLLPRWRVVDAQKIWPVPEAVVTVLCTLDDGCG